MAGPNTKKFRLPVNTGVRTDTFAEAVPLMDINNFVLTPDGSALRPREGYEIRRNDSIGYNSGRKNIYFVSNPPDINYGDLIVVVNTKNNRRFNECTEVVRTTQTTSTIDPDGNLTTMPSNPAVGTPIGYLLNQDASSYYTGMDLLLYNEDTDAFTDRITANFTRSFLNPNATVEVQRTANYLVVGEGYDYNDGPGSTVPSSPNSYLHICDLRNPTGDFDSLVTFSLPAFEAGTPSTYPNDNHHMIVVPYSNDRVLVIIMNRLYVVDLATATATELNGSITPSSDSYFNIVMDTGQPYNSFGVDVNGDIWGQYYPDSNGGTTGRGVVRLNPSTEAITLDMNMLGHTAYDGQDYGHPMAMADGSMYECRWASTSLTHCSTSGAGVRSEGYATTADATIGSPGSARYMLGTKILGVRPFSHANAWYPLIIDVTDGSVDAVGVEALLTPPGNSVYAIYDASTFAVLTNEKLRKVNATTAAITDTDASSLTAGDTFNLIPDAFGYHIASQAARI